MSEEEHLEHVIYSWEYFIIGECYYHTHSAVH